MKKTYVNYMYSYPHKKAYRKFKEDILIKELWESTSAEELDIYIHIPFCNYKCGYCNLMSIVDFEDEIIEKYIETILKEAKETSKNIKGKKIKSVILGGGTPSVLSKSQLEKILVGLKEIFDIDFKNCFLSLEVSPSSVTKEKLDLLEKFDVKRISMGIQSFVESELKTIKRCENLNLVKKAIDLIQNMKVKIKNYDLIYGIANQTTKTLGNSIEELIKLSPEEIFIYPLYIREGTNLNEEAKQIDENLEKLYDFAVKKLKNNGYVQTSMRNFIRKDLKEVLKPKFGCQKSNMLGLGCGARSYVDNVHYSRPYSVNRKHIKEIILNYIEETSFKTPIQGYKLSVEEEKRRYVIKSILKITGLNKREYKQEFKTEAIDDFKVLKELIKEGYLKEEKDFILPTYEGLKYSDYIGPIFISKEVSNKMSEFDNSEREI